MKLSNKADYRPSMQFYVKDWLTDVGLQSCSYEAKGLWIDFLCFMWLAPDRGTISAKAQQNLAKVPANTLQKIIDELLDNGVCEKNENLSLICRKMRREYLHEKHITEVRSRAGSLAKHQQKGGSSSSSSSSSSKKENMSRFKLLWSKYPRKFGKKEALRHFVASVKTDQDWENIQKALENYLSDIKDKKTETKFIQHGKSWFNNWQDWIDIAPPVVNVGLPESIKKIVEARKQ